VTANDSTGAHATFGQRADTKWGVSAPGVAILNTWPIDDPDHDGYNAIQGTSMAAPHVAGAAAVLFGMGMSAQTVAQKLVDTAGPPRDSLVEGAGLIHLDRAAGVQTTATTNAASRTAGTGTVTKSGRAGVAGGTGAIAVTTTTSTPGSREPSTGFEEGLSTKDASKDFDQIQLNQARKNGAGAPFNAAGPLIAGTAIATLAMLAVAIPRIRAKDTPLT
jgi:subtilisin family serine protease